MTSLMQMKPVQAVARPAVLTVSSEGSVLNNGEVRESKNKTMRLEAVRVFFMRFTSDVQIKPKLSNFWAKV